jgi:hypothetical protein
MGADGSMSDRRDRKNRWTKFVPYLFSVWQHDASSHCVQSHGVGFLFIQHWFIFSTCGSASNAASQVDDKNMYWVNVGRFVTDEYSIEKHNFVLSQCIRVRGEAVSPDIGTLTI